MKYSFLFAGTIKLRAPVNAPVISMAMFLATPEAPFGIVIVVSLTSEMLCVT
jgi:hypothetical protein